MARILVVDDEESVRNVVKRLLTIHDYQVDTADDGEQALERLQNASYDLMIIDRNMPRLSGIQAVEIVRSNPKFEGLKILMVTMASLTKQVDEAYEKGIDGYVVKPFDMKQLVAKVEKALKSPRRGA